MANGDDVYATSTSSYYKFFTKNASGYYVLLRQLERGTYRVSTSLNGVVAIVGNSERYVLRFKDQDDAAGFRVGA